MFDRELVEFIGGGLYQYGTDVKVSLYKLGGGTLGQSYEGNWGYAVETLDESRTIAEGEDFFTGTPKTHAQAAEIILDFVNEEE